MSIDLALVTALLLAAPQQATPPPTFVPPRLEVGDVVPPFEAEGLDGVVKHIDYPKGADTVLLFFLSGCPVCHRMIPEWNAAYAHKPKGLNVTGVLLDREPPGFFMATPVSFPVVRGPGNLAFNQTFKLYRVPLMLRVGAGGKVLDVALGQIDPIRVGEIFRP